MSYKKYYNLITTSILTNKNFSSNKKNIFLGEWCKLNNNHKDIKTIPYHWNNRKKFYKDYLYINSIYEEFLDILQNKLNSIHNVNFSKNYWRIVLGPWLFQFIAIIFDRWHMIKLSQSRYNIKSAYIANINNKNSRFTDHYEFLYSNFSDAWNNIIYEQLITNWTKIKIKKFKTVEKVLSLKKTPHYKQILFNYIINSYNKLFYKKNNLFFITPYFSSIISFFLQLRLKVIPLIWTEVRLKNLVNLYKRNFILKNKSKKKFYKILSVMIPQHLPIIYLEGYKEAHNYINKLPWPKKPKFIFSSNSFITNDLFKLWLAHQKENNKTLFISGQHGGSFFTSKFFWIENHQLKISDKTITWGYKDKINKSIIPLFNFKVAGKELKYCKQGNLLLINNAVQRNPLPIASSFLGPQYLDYLNDQYKLIKKLNVNVIKNLQVRPYPFDYGWNQTLRFKNLNLGLKFDKQQDIIKSLKLSRLCVVNFNTTVFLETFNLNFPTIVLLNEKFDELRVSAKPYFDILESAGILFYDPTLAANKINKIWENVEMWWNSQKVREALNIFCNKFSQKSKNPVKDLYKVFKNFQ
jgi:putative transferase (TIGR04331 family)